MRGGHLAAKVGQTDRLSRRRFAGLGLATPVILTLANRPAFGAVCTLSGFTSYSPTNPSGVRHVESSCGGLSPGAWRNPDAGNGDGSREQWIRAGYFPNPRQAVSETSEDKVGKVKGGGKLESPDVSGGAAYDDPPGTSFDEAFGLTGSGLGTMHDVLLNEPGTLAFHAVAALLNTSLLGYGLSKSDVIGLYQLGAGVISSYTTASGVVISHGDLDVQGFFEQTYH